jgi:hypothetical protein
MSVDPLAGIDFSERVKPLMQQMVLLDQKRMEEIASLREQLRGAVDALREIADADPIDMALDPGWAARIAKAALHAIEGGS